jgi:ABC-type sugar transport system permease subunit
MNRNSKNSFFYKLYSGRQGYLLILPLIIMILVFSYYPAISGIVHSFYNWNQFGESEFIGFGNYAELFKDPIFINSIPAMLKLLIPRLLISVFVPLIMAELIFAVRSEKMQYTYRVLCLLPMVAPGVVGTLIWKYIYDPGEGLAVTIVRMLGFVEKNQNIDWLGNPDTVIGSIIFMGFPWVGGTAVLIYLSGLMNISTEVIEASVLDGAGKFRRILHIDLPLIVGQIRYFLIFGIIGGLQDYGVQVVLTHGGPGYTTYVPGYYMYKLAFSFNRMGYASAIGTLMFLVIFILTLCTFKFLKNRD